MPGTPPKPDVAGELTYGSYLALDETLFQPLFPDLWAIRAEP